MINGKENYMSVEEAAVYLKHTTRSIRGLCNSGKLPGATKIGKKVWAIPEQSVKNYVKGLQGFAAVKARKEAEEQAELNAINAAISQAKIRNAEKIIAGHAKPAMPKIAGIGEIWDAGKENATGHVWRK